MKKVAILAVMALMSVVAFGKTLPEKAQKFLEVAFPERTILMLDAKIDCEVTLDDFTEIDFDMYGQWKEIDAKGHGDIPETAIPAQIREAINKNFEGKKIVKMERSFGGNIEVELINGVEIEFDRNFMIVNFDR